MDSIEKMSVTEQECAQDKASKPAGWKRKVKLQLKLPPGPGLSLCLGVVLLAVGLYLLIWAVFGPRALPGRGGLFSLYILWLTCLMSGWMVSVVKLPPLFAMLLSGFALSNLPGDFAVARHIHPKTSSTLRQMAFGVILIQAGLHLNINSLRKLKGVCLRLAFTPCIFEALTVGIAAHYLLGLPWIYSFMLGFVLGAVSPAILVPLMIRLRRGHLGVLKGIPTLVIAASSVDDILAITIFSVLLSAASGNSNSAASLALMIVRGPLEAGLGVVYGLGFGALFSVIPNVQSNMRDLMRFALLTTFALLPIYASKMLGIPGAGPLACLTISLVAGNLWSARDSSAHRTEKAPKPATIDSVFEYIWLLVQPFLFGLIGADIRLDALNLQSVGKAVAVICIGVAFRMVATFLCTSWTGFTYRERLFIAIAWLPKATVQAALGPVVLDHFRNLQDDNIIVPAVVPTGSMANVTSMPTGGIGDSFLEIEKYGYEILTASVLSILITAPLGAVATMAVSKHLLSNSEEERDFIKENEVEEDEDNFGTESRTFSTSMRS